MSRLAFLTLVVLAAVALQTTAAEDIFDEIKQMDIFKLKQSTLACPLPVVGQTCPEGNPLFFFKCCGELNSSCCFRLQDWLMALLVLLAVLVVISLVINFIRCLFCY